MRAVFFYPQIEKSFRASSVPLGILSIASFLKSKGHDAIICDRFFTSEKAETTLQKHNPDIIGISVISNVFIRDAMEIAEAAKSMGIPVVWGGSLSSVISKEILESGLGDYVSINEGEFTWLEMAEAFDEGRAFDGIKGLAYLRNGEYIRTEDREFIDLSVLPKLDWTLVDPKRYFQKSYGYDKMVTTYFSNGCTGRCTFCYNHKFHCSKRRQRPLEYVIEEMRYLKETHGAGGFDFTDDLMFANRSQVDEFCNAMIDSGLNTKWSGYLSVGVVNDAEGYELLYKSGCRSMIYGVESGSPKILKSVGKNIKLDKIKSNIELCANAGIVPIVMFMLGFPDETEEDIAATISLAKELKDGMIVFGFYTPIPGSKMYEELVRNKKINPLKTLEDHANVNFAEQISVNVSGVSSVELSVIRKYFRLRGLTYKSSNSEDEQLLKVITATLKAMSGRGIKHFIKSGIFSFWSLINAFGMLLHPKIRKKYGLYFTK